MEYLEDYQDFDEVALSGVVPLYTGGIPMMTNVMNLFPKEGRIQIKIHPIQGMLTFHNINAKI